MINVSNLAHKINKSYNAKRNLKSLNESNNVTHVISLMIQKQNILAAGMTLNQLNEAIEIMNK